VENARAIADLMPQSRIRDIVVCSIGSTDPTAGAGLFSDAAVFSHLGVRAAFIVAGVTAQNSKAVTSITPLPVRAIIAQLKSVWSQIRPSAVRIGLLPDARSIDAVARFLRRAPGSPPIVLDPVISATSGRIFAGPAEIEALLRLMRIATIVTPNASEAEALAGIAVDDEHSAERAAAMIARSGAAVLVKGGHLPGRSIVDLLARDGRVQRFRSARLRRDMRGTGCVLSAALAAYLASGCELEVSVRRARAFVRRAIATAKPLGNGRPQVALR
jgi:hydroxymethylpyrimidine/phosphomethylpyrimidine kinase